jgi:hypothetical protein
MGSRTTGKATGRKDEGARQLPSFLASASIKPFIPSDLMVRFISPIQYRPKHGGRTAYGYEATILPSICEVILDANKDGSLKPSQKHLAEMADILIRAFAKIGVLWATASGRARRVTPIESDYGLRISEAQATSVNLGCGGNRQMIRWRPALPRPPPEKHRTFRTLPNEGTGDAVG